MRYFTATIHIALYIATYSALSLRNLILGYECGRDFPVGLGLNSPLRDTMSTRFSRSVETRRRFGWLRMVSIRWASSELHCGVVPCRGKTGGRRSTRKRAVPRSIGWKRSRFGERPEGIFIVDEPGECWTLVPEKSKAWTGRFLRGKLISGHVCFLPTKANKERRTNDILGNFFKKTRGTLDV